MSKRTPMKGEPYFYHLSDEKLKQYRDVIEEMVYSFSDFPEEKEVLHNIWVKLSDAYIDRITDELPEEKEVSEEPVDTEVKLIKRNKVIKFKRSSRINI